MSLHSYLVSQGISAYDPPFSALIFAAIRKADSDNLARLLIVFPDLAAELQARYDAPGGAIGTEEPPDERFVAMCMAEVGYRR